MNEYLDEVVTALDSGTVPGWITEHARRYVQTDGREGHLWDATAVGGTGAVPCLLLTTVGRRSGRPYTHPLLYGMRGEDYVIVASKGGADSQPQWYYNLLANPAVTVQVMADRFPARATLASVQARPALWDLMTRVYPTYRDYQAKTQREIPLFVLSRQAG